MAKLKQTFNFILSSLRFGFMTFKFLPVLNNQTYVLARPVDDLHVYVVQK